MANARQLAAIMFTDIVGYTALMGEDEQRAFQILNQNREIHKPIIQQFGGRWIKELGDGVLASFLNATDAVLSACAIQKACAKVPDLKLRIGIHLGDVVFENNDVFGDTVNIAARLQALAPAGNTWISEQVYKNIANNKEVVTRLVGEESLKNVKEPVRVYVVYPKGYKPEFTSLKPEPASVIPIKSIAVLPFVNMSNDPEQDYFSDGMAEEILNSLVHLKDLKVVGRTSSFHFKGKNIDLRELGEKLGVSTVLEGSVRKQGNRIRITAQLINVKDGFHFWSEKYDRTMDDIFAIQDEIALAITEQLKVSLFEKDRALVTKSATQNAYAYELYLKGMFHLNRRGSSILTGLEYFKQAIAADPEYALAYSGYADACFLGAFYSYFPGREAMPKVKEAVETAIKLDDSRCEAFCTLAQYYIGLEWNWPEAEKNYLKSIELNPKFSQTHALYGMAFLGFVYGKYEEAEAQGRLAIQLEPLRAIDHADLAWTLYTTHKYEEGLAMALTGIELDNNSFLSQRLAGLCFLGLQRYEEAIDTFNYLIKISNRHQHAINSLIWAYCHTNSKEKAKALMDELEKRAKTEYVAGTYLSISAAWMGDVDKAMVYLEQAYHDHDPTLITINKAPFVPELLRNNARFQNVLNRVGFPD